MQKQRQIQKNIQHYQQQGLGTIFVIIILVILAGLAAGIVWISRQQQLVIADDVREAKINQLALTALEWGKARVANNILTTPLDPVKADINDGIKICDPNDNSISATVKIKTTEKAYETSKKIPRYITKINAVACSVSCDSESKCGNADNSNYREKYVETILDYCDLNDDFCKVYPNTP